MTDIEQNLKKYLEIESILNAFFAVFDYCLEHCIKPELLRSSNQPVSACCKKKYYKRYDLDHPAFDRLREMREVRYGKPADHQWISPVSPCEYHNPKKGCILTTHKSPVCLAFMCRESIDFLRETYGIYGYDYLGVNYALEWILTGDFSKAQYEEFKQGIQTMTQTVLNGPCASSIK